MHSLPDFVSSADHPVSESHHHHQLLRGLAGLRPPPPPPPLLQGRELLHHHLQMHQAAAELGMAGRFSPPGGMLHPGNPTHHRLGTLPPPQIPLPVSRCLAPSFPPTLPSTTQDHTHQSDSHAKSFLERSLKHLASPHTAGGDKGNFSSYFYVDLFIIIFLNGVNLLIVNLIGDF